MGYCKRRRPSPIKAVCAAHNISAATYHAWKRKFGGMEVSEAKSLRALESRSLRNKSNRINRFVLVKLSQNEVHLIHVEKSRIWIPAVFE